MTATQTNSSTQAGPQGADPIEHTTLSELAQRLEKGGRAAAVFGEPIERDGITVVPVARARWCVGGGSGQSKAKDELGSGAGGGVEVAPVGYIELKQSETSFRWIVTPGAVVQAVIGGLIALLLLRRLL